MYVENSLPLPVTASIYQCLPSNNHFNNCTGMWPYLIFSVNKQKKPQPIFCVLLVAE